MAKVAPKPQLSATKPANQTKSGPTEVVLNQFLKDEIARLSETEGVSAKLLEEFAVFVIQNHKRKPVKPKPVKPLPLTKLKEAIYQHFEVKNTTELKKSGAFKMATDGMDDLNLSVREGWERLYRKFVGILPDEENQQGYGCINGINIFNYFRPWQVFGLDPTTATSEQIKTAYRELSKLYHPDMQSGDARIFERINIMYRSISAEA